MPAIKLVNCNVDILSSILKNDGSLGKLLNVCPAKNWTESEKEVFEFFLKEILEHPESKKWLLYLVIEISTNTLIGSCGFKGRPCNGCVEIGYEIAETFRNKGYASEAVNFLFKMACKDVNVDFVKAQTLDSNLASKRVLEKCKFKLLRKFWDDQNNLVSEWVKRCTKNKTQSYQ